MDAQKNGRLQSDDKEDDPGSGEIDGEDEKTLADEEERETARGCSSRSSHYQSNGFRVAQVNGEEEDKDEEVQSFIQPHLAKEGTRVYG